MKNSNENTRQKAARFIAQIDSESGRLPARAPWSTKQRMDCARRFLEREDSRDLYELLSPVLSEGSEKCSFDEYMLAVLRTADEVLMAWEGTPRQTPQQVQRSLEQIGKKFSGFAKEIENDPNYARLSLMDILSEREISAIVDLFLEYQRGKSTIHRVHPRPIEPPPDWRRELHRRLPTILEILDRLAEYSKKQAEEAKGITQPKARHAQLHFVLRKVHLGIIQRFKKKGIAKQLPQAAAQFVNILFDLPADELFDERTVRSLMRKGAKRSPADKSKNVAVE